MSTAVVVPCLGDADAVETTVKSIQNNHMPPDTRIYVLEAGEPVELDLSAGDFEVLYTHMHFRGPGLPRVRNTALQLLDEDQLLFTQPGDFLYPDHFELMTSVDADVVYARWRYDELEAPREDFDPKRHMTSPFTSWVDGNLLLRRRTILNALGDQPFLETAGLQDEFRFIALAAKAGLDLAPSPAVTVDKADLPRARVMPDPRRNFNSSDKRGNVVWRGSSSVRF